MIEWREMDTFRICRAQAENSTIPVYARFRKTGTHLVDRIRGIGRVPESLDVAFHQDGRVVGRR